MKNHLLAVMAVAALAASGAAHASNGYIGLYDFGYLGTAGGHDAPGSFQILSQSATTRVYTPGGPTWASSSGSGPSFSTSAGAFGGTTQVSAWQHDGDPLMKLTNDPLSAGATPGTIFVTQVTYTATFSIAAHSTFTGSPLINIGYTGLASDDPAFNFAKATVRTFVDTGTRTFDDSESVTLSSASKVPSIDDGMAASFTNNSDAAVTGTFTATGEIWSHAIAPVPEPASVAMLLAGMGMLGLMARRQRG